MPYFFNDIRSLIHGVCYHLFVYVGTPLILFPMIPFLRRSEKHREYLASRLVLRVAKMSLQCAGIKTKAAGLENFEKLKGTTYILVANHITSLDVPVQMAALNTGNMRYVYSTDVFASVPLIGGLSCKLFDALGWIGVQNAHLFALKRLHNYLKNLIKNKETGPVVIFPEGRRSWDGDMNSFRQGAFYLSYQLQLPILPVLMHGLYACHKPGSLRVHPNEVTVEVLPPVLPPAKKGCRRGAQVY